jgi:hypothetical protein
MMPLLCPITGQPWALVDEPRLSDAQEAQMCLVNNVLVWLNTALASKMDKDDYEKLRPMLKGSCLDIWRHLLDDHFNIGFKELS